MDQLSEKQVRSALRPYQDGGDISALFETGEIRETTFVTLGMAIDSRDSLSDEAEGDTLTDVIEYVQLIGERPAVPGWGSR